MFVTLKEFISLNDEERYSLWLASAVKVGVLENNFFCYMLYQLESFYIELRMFKLLPAEVKLYILTDHKLIEPYLEQIDISELGL